MNEIKIKKIKEYYNITNTWFDKYVKDKEISKSEIQERIMRIGVEARAFDVDSETNLLEIIAVSTIKKDRVEKLIKS